MEIMRLKNLKSIHREVQLAAKNRLVLPVVKVAAVHLLLPVEVKVVEVVKAQVHHHKNKLEKNNY